MISSNNNIENAGKISNVSFRINFFNKIMNILKTREVGVFIALVILMVIISIIRPVFFNINNLLNISRQISTFSIMAAGMAILMILGEIDISIGSMLALVVVCGGYFINNGVNEWIAFILMLVLGIFFGFINGFIIVKTGIHSLIITIGTMSIFRGLALLISGGWPYQVLPKAGSIGEKFFFLGEGKIFSIPFQAIIMLFIIILASIFLNSTVWGRHIYAIGGNSVAAKRAGANSFKLRIFSFCFLGFLVALSGAIQIGLIKLAEPQAGSGYELIIIAACVIGGIRLGGGYGKVIGAFLGSIIMGVIKNGLVMLRVSAYWQTITVGIIIIIAVSIDKFIEIRSEKSEVRNRAVIS